MWTILAETDDYRTDTGASNRLPGKYLFLLAKTVLLHWGDSDSVGDVLYLITDRYSHG